LGTGDEEYVIPPPPGTGSEDSCSVVGPEGNIYYVDCSEVPALQQDGFEIYAGKPTNWKLIGGVALGAAAVLGAVFYMRK
jgi:hypothetical protein